MLAEVMPGFAAVPVSPFFLHRRNAVLNWETGEGKSYAVPALEIPAFLLSLNIYDRLKYGSADYGTTPDTFQDNLVHQKWKYDTDSFRMNQFEHPLLGSIMYGFARSSGLSFWESWLYSNSGSLLWETAGETTRPSINDLIVTGQAGSLLGEPFFRIANLLLEGGGGDPGFWRKLGATAVSPPTAINRLLFGERFRALYPARSPAAFVYLQFMGTSHNTGGSGQLNKSGGSADLHLAYGLPGKDGYKYTRPFDYFNLEASVNTGRNGLENVMVRGLLAGKKYERGEDFRGVFGVYGSYDYISPTVFRVSNTSASLGTTGQWWLSRNTALQGTLLAGPGYGGGGLVPSQGRRNYHMGLSSQGLAALRLIVDRKLMLDLNVRSYLITGLSSPNSSTSEKIDRGDISLSLLIHGPHAVGLQYVESRRHSTVPFRGEKHQRVSVVGLSYTLSFDPHFGAVEWRDGMDSGNR